MSLPYRLDTALPRDVFARVRHQTIFRCCKWDPQVGDEATLAPQPLIIPTAVYRQLSTWAEDLTRETLAAERELQHAPQLVRELGLPGSIQRALRNGARPPHPADVRVMRFDFHFTTEGWRISEVNADVPGGFNEAEGFTALMAPHFPRYRTPPGIGLALAQALAHACPPDQPVALVHATAYSDDRQVMEYLAEILHGLGRTTEFIAPDHVSWRDGRAYLNTAWTRKPIGLLARFYPAEWLPTLPRSSRWQNYFSAPGTPQANPATAILTQSKRFPLLWDRLQTALPTWRSLLPVTLDPRAAPRHDENWIRKPALGRIGEDIGLPGITRPRDLRRILRAARWWPRHWIAQRRFEIQPVSDAGIAWFPCLGIYTVNGKAAGLYGRMARTALIDGRARDVAVLLEPEVSTREVAA